MAIVVVFDYLVAARSYFFGDDFVVLWQSRTHGLTLDYLTSPATAHFGPGHRFLSYALYRIAGFNFGAALALLLAFHAAAVVILLQRVLAALFGRVWWSYVLALAFGLSVFTMAMLWWFSPGLLSLPSIAFSLASIHAYLWWWRTRRKTWLVWSVVALCLGAAVLREGGPRAGVSGAAADVPAGAVAAVRRHLRVVLRQWRVWLLFAAPVAVYLIVD